MRTLLATLTIFMLTIALANAACTPADGAEVCLMKVKPSAPLAAGEAYGLVVKIGEIGRGNVLSVFDKKGKLIGSIAQTFGLPLPQSARIGLVRILDADALEVEVRVHPKDSFSGRPPRENELLSLELLPIGITR